MWKEQSLNAKDEALVGYKVVMCLLEGQEDKGHIVTCEFFNFTQIVLGFDVAMGTTKTNKQGWPQALTLANQGPERGNILQRMHASNVLATITWYDNKPVSLLSTAFLTNDMKHLVFLKICRKTAEKSIVSSHILVHYQTHMRGVDVADQL